MKYPYYLLALLFITSIAMSGCKKAAIAAGSVAPASIYFIHRYYDENIDSLNYSFVLKDSTVHQDTIWLPVRIGGQVADHDRPVNLVVLSSGTTAVAGKHYRLLNYSIPRGAFSGNLGIVLLRSADLQDTMVTLTLQLQPNSDFPVMMKDTIMADGSDKSRSQYKISFTDRLIKPSNWDQFLVYFFGTYSEVKFRFIVDVLGVASFPSSGPDAIGIGQIFYYQSAMENAIASYNAIHGPLYDEFGNAVTFP